MGEAVRRLDARICERCGQPFVVARRFTTTICGPCELARVAQKAEIDRKYEYRRGPGGEVIQVGDVRAVREEE